MTEKQRKTKKIKAYLSNKQIFSNDESAFALYEKSRFGENIDEKIHYMLVEALFLVEIKKMNIYQKSKKLSLKKLKEKLGRIDRNLGIKYMVFRDMRSRGYILKTALKFGADFRIYEKGAKPGEKHAKWILYPVSENDKLTWQEFSAKNRVAHSTRKNLLIAIVDQEGDVSYYEVKWTKP